MDLCQTARELIGTPSLRGGNSGRESQFARKHAPFFRCKRSRVEQNLSL